MEFDAGAALAVERFATVHEQTTALAADLDTTRGRADSHRERFDTDIAQLTGHLEALTSAAVTATTTVVDDAGAELLKMLGELSDTLRQWREASEQRAAQTARRLQALAENVTEAREAIEPTFEAAEKQQQTLRDEIARHNGEFAEQAGELTEYLTGEVAERGETLREHLAEKHKEAGDALSGQVMPHLQDTARSVSERLEQMSERVRTFTDERKSDASSSTEEALTHLTDTVQRTVGTIAQRVKEVESLFERVSQLVSDTGDTAGRSMSEIAECSDGAAVGLKTAIGILTELQQLFDRVLDRGSR